MLDPMNMPIRGQHGRGQQHWLIEASAGTGKTYTILCLTLRLLLGQDGQNEPLTIDQILISTFTRAATLELRERLRQCLREAKNAFNPKPDGTFGDELKGHNPFLYDLREKSAKNGKLDRDRKLLQSAIEQIDEAAIFTIHGFCRKLLNNLQLEAGLILEKKLVTDLRRYKLKAYEQFWRSYFYGLDSETGDFIRGFYPKLSRLSQLLDRCLSSDSDAEVIGAVESTPEALRRLRQKLREVGALWGSRVRQEILNTQRQTGKLERQLNQFDRWVEQGCSLLVAERGLLKQNKSLASSLQLLLEDTADRCRKIPNDPIVLPIRQAIDCCKTIKSTFVSQAIREVKQHIREAKRKDGVQDFDDLISLTLTGLNRSKGKVLAQKIRERYRVAFLDEFQDTSFNQWQLFNQIYPPDQLKQEALVMVGDPKQAIFGFRGADLDNYIRVRKTVPPANRVDMTTNWRSSVPMIEAINALYQKHPNPFANDEIKFKSVGAPPPPDTKNDTWYLDGEPQPALRLLENQESSSNKQEMTSWAADSLATEVVRIARQNPSAEGSPIKLNDLMVLVNNRYEAEAIRKALAKQGLSGGWQSRRSVFSNQTAQDLLMLLEAMIAGHEPRLIRLALATDLVDWPLERLQWELKDKEQWPQHLERFEGYHAMANKGQLSAMLFQFISDYQVAAGPKALGYQRTRVLTDLRQLVDLLQQEFAEMDSLYQLKRWLARQIESDTNEDEQEYRLDLDSDEELIQIDTIFGVKGLEYSLVFIPFGVSPAKVRASTGIVRRTGEKLALNLHPNESEIQKELDNQLSSQLRLLYVALTRSKYGCLLWVAGHEPKPAKSKRSPKSGCPVQHLLGKSPLDKQKPSEVIEAKPKRRAENEPPEKKKQAQARDFPGEIDQSWGVHSSTSLIRHSLLPRWNFSAPVQAGSDSEEGEHNEASLDIAFRFPKGAEPGICLHSILETWPERDQQEHVSQIMERHRLGAELDQAKVLGWLEQIRQTPLGMGTDLHTLTGQAHWQEMSFYLPAYDFNSRQLCRLLERHGYNPQLQSDLSLNGMFNGFIDLVFEHQGIFWVADYKSNYLGNRHDDYSESAIAQSVYQHHYDLQLLLYSLALVRWLKVAGKDDPYSHFGGVCYLFLRGMDGSGKTGVYRHLPSKEALNELDHCFEGHG